MLARLTIGQYLNAIAKETARMSYPSRMGGVVKKGTKKKVEAFFETRFPIESLWKRTASVAREYEAWHGDRVFEIAQCLRGQTKRSSDNPRAVAAKFLNTYMHQLMKYGAFRSLFPHLHLPLDRVVLGRLWKLAKVRPALKPIRKTLRKYKDAPYAIRYPAYIRIQKALLNLLQEINRASKLPRNLRLTSRLHLNILWSE